MVKTLNVDVDKLEQKIKDSGLKIDFICETLGLSRQGFTKKRNGITPFRIAEVFVLCALLNINDVAEKNEIFYP